MATKVKETIIRTIIEPPHDVGGFNPDFNRENHSGSKRIYSFVPNTEFSRYT